jgi:hypothetical protein
MSQNISIYVEKRLLSLIVQKFVEALTFAFPSEKGNENDCQIVCQLFVCNNKWLSIVCLQQINFDQFNDFNHGQD